MRVSPRARRLRLRVDPRTRAVLLTVPKRTSKSQALAWAAGHRDWIETSLGGPAETLEGRILRWLKAEARSVLGRETEDLAAKAKARLVRIGIGDPVSRWGSCSASGSIRYSWRLILAPDFVRRATVAHEVAHLIHLNHGREFHLLVEALLGEDPRPARLWLRREGAALHRIGRRG